MRPTQNMNESNLAFALRFQRWLEAQDAEAKAEAKVIDRLGAHPKHRVEHVVSAQCKQGYVTIHDMAVNNPLLRNLIRSGKMAI
jgi:hypothetical protein